MPYAPGKEVVPTEAVAMLGPPTGAAHSADSSACAAAGSSPVRTASMQLQDLQPSTSGRVHHEAGTWQEATAQASLAAGWPPKSGCMFTAAPGYACNSCTGPRVFCTASQLLGRMVLQRCQPGSVARRTDSAAVAASHQSSSCRTDYDACMPSLTTKHACWPEGFLVCQPSHF